jgi:hypothetical protein
MPGVSGTTDRQLVAEVSSAPCVLFDKKDKLFVESTLGEGKCTYWTADVDAAQVFEGVDAAITLLLRLSNKERLSVRTLIEEYTHE